MDRSPISRPYLAHALCHYPENRAWNADIDWDAIVMLCFPRGLRFKRDDADRRIRFHTFVLTRDDGSRVYGANLIFHERVQDKGLLMAMSMLQQMHEVQRQAAAGGSGSTAAAAAVVTTATTVSNAAGTTFLSPSSSRGKNKKQLSSSPTSAASNSAGDDGGGGDGVVGDDGSGGLGVGSPFNVNRDALYAPKSICLLSQVPAVACFEEYLRQLYSLSQTTEGSTWERHVGYLLHQVPLPPPRPLCSAAGSALVYRSLPRHRARRRTP